MGSNTVYRNGQPVDAGIEAANDPGCTPIAGVRFTFGAGIRKAGQYSTVTTGNSGVDGTSAPTSNNVSLLDSQGAPTGGTLDGATTYQLNAAQVAQASRSSQFWVQGGTPTQPLPSRAGGGSYGFAALRCAVDNLNGDNVEWIGFPTTAQRTGSVHVFCYAYYLDTPPAQGSITIRKQLTPGSTVSQRFTFASNATYNPSGTFDLSVADGRPAQTTFTRAVSSAFGGPYTFAEDLSKLGPQGWTLTSLTCTGSTDTVISGAKVSITLHAGENIVCTYLDDPPHDPGLTVRKVTDGAVGTFPMIATRIQDAVGNPVSSPSYPLTATTTQPEVPVEATGLPANVPAGIYRITETLPTVPGGTWSVDSSYCNGIPARTVSNDGTELTVTLTVNGTADCTFVNTFTPHGALRLHLITHGATGTAAFDVTHNQPAGTDVAQPSGGLAQQATTTMQGTPATATGDPTDQLTLGDYTITSTPPVTTSAGSWIFNSFTCDAGRATPDDGSTVTVTLTPAQPVLTCTAVYTLLPPSTFTVVKTIAGPPAARTGPVRITVTCEDGQHATLTTPATGTGPFTLNPAISFVEPTRCTVSETDTGAAPHVTVTTTAQLITGTAARDADVHLPATVTLSRAHPSYTLRIYDRYTAKPITTAPSTGNSSASTTTRPDTSTSPSAASGSLADTGPTMPPAQLLGVAAGLLAAGAVLLTANRRRRRPRRAH